jgi:Ca2+-binding RTX toxin-like protein
MPIFTGTTGNDTLTGTASADTITGNGGSDTITAGDGDDTVVLTAQAVPFGVIDGGAGSDTLQIDRMYTPINAQGPGGAYLFHVAPLTQAFSGVTPLTLVTGFERLAFNSQVGDLFSASMNYGGSAGQVNQIGPALAVNAELIGGAGVDILNLGYTASTAGGVVNAPNFTYTNWTTPTRAYQGGDRVSISVGGTNGVTINGSAHSGIQGLFGGSGSDTINGSEDMDLISGGSGGTDFLYGNGGNDGFTLTNSYLINPTTGAIGAESTRTGANTLFDGGNGTDFLILGGNVNFQGTLANIEGLYLSPGYTNLNAGATIALASQYSTFVQFSSAAWASLPGNLIVDGSGTVLIRAVAAGATVDLSGVVFEAGAAVLFDLRGDAGNDTLTGTARNDGFSSSGGVDVMNGGAGNDTFYLYNPVGAANGGADNDVFILYSGAQASNIAGGSGTDQLYAAADTVLTGTISGIESIGVQSANLTMTGNTFATGFAANSNISGTGTIIVNMDAGTAFLGQSLIMATTTVSFNIVGSAGVDIIKATINAVNVINGGDSTDQIRGGALADTINGGQGNDKIIGFTGADIITGGDGADQFRYLFATDSGLGVAADHITDFLAGLDKFNFTLLDADPVAAGRQAAQYIDTAAFSGVGYAELRYSVSGADLLVQVDLDGNGTADMEIVLDNAAATQVLSSGDFLL